MSDSKMEKTREMDLKAGVKRKRIFIVSDGTGETAAQMTKAALIQFMNQVNPSSGSDQADVITEQNVYFSRHKNIRTELQMEALLEDALPTKDLIIYTIVSPQLRTFLISRATELQIPVVDLLSPLLRGLASYFGYEPKAIAGLLHDVNERYFKRIDAMEFTIAHDDGKDLSNLDQADVILLGISRTSKTPLSMYLSHQGWKVVNIPIIKDFEIPEALFKKADQRRIVGLTIDPEDLTLIRRNRLTRLGQERGGDYADPDKINDEIAYADQLFERNRKWPVINVTGKALEETASEIIRLMSSRRLTPQSL